MPDIQALLLQIIAGMAIIALTIHFHGRNGSSSSAEVMRMPETGERKLFSIEDYCQAFLGGEDYLLTNGDAWFDKKGVQI